MNIVTLMENTACREGILCEHGLSLYIETGEHRILFDAGQTGAFADNARELGVDLQAVTAVVLSHGHYDHGGGLTRFLECNDRAPVFLSRYAFGKHYNEKGRDIGLDPALKQENRLHYTDGVFKIAEGLVLHSISVPPADPAGLLMSENGVLQPEDFRHEQYLLVEEAGKRICFSGCSHKGILQIAAHFQPDVLIGGFHFMKIQEEEWLNQAAQNLLRYPTVYYTGHCTGQRQFEILKETLGDRLHYLSTGSTVLL